MDDLFMLSKAQMRGIKLFSPLSHGVPRVDDRLIVSAIIFVIKNDLRWREAPRSYAQDDLQPLHLLEPIGGVQPHLRRTGRQGREA
jgi:transposase